MTLIGRLIRSVLARFAPPPRLTVSQWADAERMLSEGASPEPGRWSTAREPYQRGIMDAIHEGAETIVLMKSAQIGATEMLLNAIGYHMAHDPCPMMLVEPTIDPMARDLSRERLAPMLRDTPALRGLVRLGRAKDSSNSLTHKTFSGGFLALAGANSPASLASRPIRLLLLDEIDKYPAHFGTEGDVVTFAMKRTTRFWNRRHLIVSTPTIRGASRIEAWFLESDQRRYFVPCPACAHMHVLAWANVKWSDHDPATAHFVCPACAAPFCDVERRAAVARGEWRATAPFRGVVGFHIWEAYASTTELARIVANFLRARALGRETLREWQNQTLGETYEDEGERAEPHVLLARREVYAADVPARACCLTLGLDTQDDRLEALVVAWGPGEESWCLAPITLPGDPARPEVWRMLDQVLTGSYRHEAGAQLVILATAIDSAGHRTDHVYEYARRNQHLRVYATIGRDGPRPLVSAPSERRWGRDPRPVRLYTVGVDAAKALIASRLLLTAPGPGFVHLPIHDLVGEEFVAQLTAEKLVTKYHKGLATRVWVATRPRNEALDGFVLALAALRLLNPRLEDMATRLVGAVHAEATAAGATATSGAAPPGRRITRSAYLGG